MLAKTLEEANTPTIFTCTNRFTTDLISLTPRIKDRSWEGSTMYLRISRGITFWIVDIQKNNPRFRFFLILINQKWNGASPIFITTIAPVRNVNLLL